MLKFVAALVGGVLVAIVTISTVFVIGMRHKSVPVLQAMGRLNRAVFNPRQMKSAGTPGAYASVIRHKGRTTANPYETPVVAVTTMDGFVISLPYGSHPDWLKNVLANGSATIVNEGQTYLVDQPQVIPIEDSAVQHSEKEQRSYRLYGTDQCLRLRRVPPGQAGMPADGEPMKASEPNHKP